MCNDVLEDSIYSELHDQFGLMIGGADLQKLLGFKSPDALRKAAERGTLQLPIFMLVGRRSHFALTREVARMIANARRAAPYRPGIESPVVSAPAG